MADNTYAVVFTGQLVEGADPEQVKANFAVLFKVEPERVAPMFTGKPVTIRKGLDEATAGKYQQALLKAGAVCRLVDQTAVEPAAPTPPPATPAQPQPPAAKPDDTSPAVAALNATLAEPGVTLIEPTVVEAARIDTSHLTMAEVGVTLVETVPVAELQVDVSRLTMAEAGALLVMPGAVERLEVDTSALSLE